MSTPAHLKSRLAELPSDPGVYLYKDTSGRIIYVGKASILKRRVKSYFTKRHLDVKTPILVQNIASVDWIVTGSEVEALFLEAELIKRYKPLYNVLEKDDKSFQYIKITTQEDFPRISLVRRPADDKATYYGPFVGGSNVREALRYLRRIFPYFSNSRLVASSALEHQIGVAPRPDISKAEYRTSIRRLMMVLSGKSTKLLSELEKSMQKSARAKRFEEAAVVRNQYLALKGLSRKVIFGSQEGFDIAMDQALTGLAEVVGLKSIPKRLECYDISNFQGGDAVSSMVVFTNGTPHHAEYRKFKMQTKGPNDFAMMAETMRRRFSGRHLDWPKPDLIIIDGGKGQLAAATAVLDELSITIPTIGLAKRHEQIVQRLQDSPAPKAGNQTYQSMNGEFRVISLHHGSKVLQLLQRIRDEAHRFAVSYHTTLRDKRVRQSVLDTIPGVGEVTRKRLIRAFGSVAGIRKASLEELSSVIGPAKARIIQEHIT
ncbi:excinuclease ABC subunit UvrC [Candidatus Saccharibacteria bacterium]|nr:excinuclease ABC subunit UvrC [Candidatus Saccharibacteria bacterium]